MRKKIFIFLFLGIISKCYSQRETFNWYFGANSGINFSTNPPKSLNNSSMVAGSVCGTISDSKGRLLFYTNGTEIWDSTHALMPNGSNIRGAIGGTPGVSILIFNHPDSSHIFFVYTLQSKNAPPSGLFCSVIDMNLNSGKGDVVQGRKNVRILDSLSKCLTVVKHSNGKDYWIIGHKLKSDSLVSLKMSADGKFQAPIFNKIGQYKLFRNSYITGDGVYGLRSSPDGSKIIFNVNNWGYNDTCFLMDFNSTSGTISNLMFFTEKGCYGAEFNNRSNLLYICTFTPTFLLQFNAKARNLTELLASRKIIDSIQGSAGSVLQMGPDGKIYEAGSRNFLGVIHAPDSIGTNCRYQKNYIPLNKFSLRGLPYFIPDYLQKRPFSVFRKCLHDSTLFTLWDDYNIDSLNWNFGDGTQLMIREAKDSIYHIYHDTGTYVAILQVYYKNYKDTFLVKFKIEDHQPFLGNDTLICQDFSFKLMSKGKYQKYFWPHDSSTNDFAEIKSGGSFVLNVIDSIGCRGTDTIQITNPIFQTRINTVDSLQCFDSNTFYMSFNSKVLNDTLKSINWYASDGSTSIDSFWNKSFGVSGKYKITLTLTGASQCRDTSYSFVEVFSNQKGKILSNNDSVCLEGKQFDFKYNSNIVKHYWNFGDGDSASNANPSKKYSTFGKYRIKYIGIDSNGCVYSDSLNVLVIKATNHATLSADTQCLKGNLFKGAVDSGKLSYDWNMGDGTVYNKRLVKHNFSKTGSFDVVVQTKDSLSCLSADTFKVHVLESPIAKFSIDSMKCSDMVTFIDGSVNSSSRIWKIENDTFLAFEFKYKVNGNKKFNVMLISYNQQSLCPDTIKAEIDFSNLLSGGKLIVPNVFTPGTLDAFNDLYKLGGLNHDCGDVADVQIYNRWGVLVYKGDLTSDPWNGTLMNQGEALSSGTYYYILKVSRGTNVDTGEIEQVSGVIYLIR